MIVRERRAERQRCPLNAGDRIGFIGTVAGVDIDRLADCEARGVGNGNRIRAGSGLRGQLRVWDSIETGGSEDTE